MLALNEPVSGIAGRRRIAAQWCRAATPRDRRPAEILSAIRALLDWSGTLPMKMKGGEQVRAATDGTDFDADEWSLKPFGTGSETTFHVWHYGPDRVRKVFIGSRMPSGRIVVTHFVRGEWEEQFLTKAREIFQRG